MKRTDTLKRATFVATLAFLLYGGWAFYANWSHGFSAGLKAALTQGGLCFILTFVSANLMEFFFKFGKRGWTRVAWSVCGAGTVALIGLVAAHLIMGTPEILTSVLPASLLSIPYYIAYSLYLLRLWKKTA